MEKKHVYQFGIRRADEKKKQFIIERDLLYSEDRLSQAFVQEIAEKHKCDVRIEYLGTLTPPKKEEIIEGKYHTPEMIEDYIVRWKESEREAFVNANN